MAIAKISLHCILNVMNDGGEFDNNVKDSYPEELQLNTENSD